MRPSLPVVPSLAAEWVTSIIADRPPPPRVEAIRARVAELTTLTVTAHWTPFDDGGRWDLRAGTESVSSTGIDDRAFTVEDAAQSIARAFWMAALADQESDRCAWP